VHLKFWPNIKIYVWIDCFLFSFSFITGIKAPIFASVKAPKRPPNEAIDEWEKGVEDTRLNESVGNSPEPQGIEVRYVSIKDIEG